MTRSIRETFRLFEAAHPDTAIGVTKFYSLRPKWVVYSSWHEVCVCTYGANIKLSVCALGKATGIIRSAEDIRELTICDIPSIRSVSSASATHAQQLKLLLRLAWESQMMMKCCTQPGRKES
ncbi:unnamed protein product [Ixodes hexagonus]